MVPLLGAEKAKFSRVPPAPVRSIAPPSDIDARYRIAEPDKAHRSD